MQVTAIPEPSTTALGLFGVGAALAAVRGRKRIEL
jgi:hypothetical protein